MLSFSNSRKISLYSVILIVLLVRSEARWPLKLAASRVSFVIYLPLKCMYSSMTVDDIRALESEGQMIQSAFCSWLQYRSSISCVAIYNYL